MKRPVTTAVDAEGGLFNAKARRRREGAKKSRERAAGVRQFDRRAP